MTKPILKLLEDSTKEVDFLDLLAFCNKIEKTSPETLHVILYRLKEKNKIKKSPKGFSLYSQLEEAMLKAEKIIEEIPEKQIKPYFKMYLGIVLVLSSYKFNIKRIAELIEEKEKYLKLQELKKAEVLFENV